MWVSEYCGMISIYNIEVIFSKSNVRFNGVIVLACDCGLVEDI